MFLYTASGSLVRSYEHFVQPAPAQVDEEQLRRAQQLIRDSFLRTEDPSRYEASQEEKELLRYILTTNVDLSIYESLPSQMPLIRMRIEGSAKGLVQAVGYINSGRENLQQKGVPQLKDLMDHPPDVSAMDEDIARLQQDPPSPMRDDNLSQTISSRKDILDSHQNMLLMAKKNLLDLCGSLKNTMDANKSMYDDLMKFYKPRVGEIDKVMAHCQKFLDFKRLEDERLARITDRNTRYTAHNAQTPLLPKLPMMEAKAFVFPPITPVTTPVGGSFTPEGDLLPIPRSSTKVTMTNASSILEDAKQMKEQLGAYASKLAEIEVIIDEARKAIAEAEVLIASVDVPSIQN